MIIPSFTGFLAGILHVVSGPDHLAAVAPFAVENRGKSWFTGMLWGIGHTGGVWLIGMLAFLFREILPIDLISTYSERMVGLVLIFIGIWGMRKALKTRVHYHEHQHAGIEHAHFHVHEKIENHEHLQIHRHSHAPLTIGILHGLAGSSHFLGVLPALMLPTTASAVAYVVSYGVGSIASMILFTHVIGLFAKKYAKTTFSYTTILIGLSIMAMVVGIYWLFLI